MVDYCDKDRQALNVFSEKEYQVAIDMRVAHRGMFFDLGSKEFKLGQKVIVGADYSMPLGYIDCESPLSGKWLVTLPSKYGNTSCYISDCYLLALADTEVKVA
jgi:hypothetical protein